MPTMFTACLPRGNYVLMTLSEDEQNSLDVHAATEHHPGSTARGRLNPIRRTRQPSRGVNDGCAAVSGR